MDKGGAGPRGKKRVVSRKRKKNIGITCDERCETCKAPCDKPLHPEKVKKRK